MKNKIEYYYNIMNINVHERSNSYYFTYNGKKYVFFICTRNVKELEELYTIQSNLKKYHKIILNINKNVITMINNRNYVLIQINDYKKEKITINDIINGYKINNIRNVTLILRNDWYDLWIKKIDYILYQRTHLRKEHLELDEMLDYFLGMAENAISYVNDSNIKEKKDDRDDLVISHRRITSLYKNDFYNIKDVIIDHPTRDISEYLKYLFYMEQIDYNYIKEVIKNLNLSSYGYRLLFGRMIFPTNFLDLYENIINNELDEEYIKYVVTKIYDYEEFLRFIYVEINKKTKIPNIEWLS